MATISGETPTPSHPTSHPVSKAGTALAQPNQPASNQPKEVTSLVALDFDPSGAKSLMTADLPTSGDFSEWNLKQQIIMLKKGAWKKYPFSDILFAIGFANRMGLDIFLGDVYCAGEGRMALSSKAKIKMAMWTGKILGWTAEITELNEMPEVLKGCVQKKELLCTVTIEVKGLNKPVVRKAKLSRWFKASNPNWVGNPEHMLELNTLAHACELIVEGMPSDADGAPPDEMVEDMGGGQTAKDIVAELKKEKEKEKTDKVEAVEGEYVTTGV